ncbi:MAG: TIM barrel protein [Treponema sp.]|jgi:hydroxypyruvate isomerase|nr:TIM barrel protein [Treponema sp.]
MRFSVCVESLFPGNDIAQKSREAKRAGADAFEFWTWWDKDLCALRKAADETGLCPAAMCTKFVSLTDPAEREAYRKGLMESLAAAKVLGCKTLIGLTGSDTGENREKQRESIIAGLKTRVPMLEDAEVTLVVESLNTKIDHKGYYLWQASEAFAIISAIGSPHVRMLYDIYHQQIMEGDIINTVTENIDKIGHIHAAGVPGRGELDSGELNYPAIFAAIEKVGYKGFLGLEYFPKGDPVADLVKLFRREF